MPETATGTALEPVRALRYDQGRVDLASVVAPPYDVISPAEREALAARDEHSIVHLILPDSPSRAAQLLHDWRREGVLVRDEEPALWWHEQRYLGPDGAERIRRGFLAALRLSPYADGRIRPHEGTHSASKENRLELLRAVRTNLSPIFCLYDDPEGRPRAALEPAAQDPPAMEVRDPDGTVHRFWPVPDGEALRAVQEALADAELLIADGHHRYETALAYRDERRAHDGDAAGDRPYDFMLAYLANLHGEGLEIYPTHRVILGRREVTPDLLAAFAVRDVEGTPAEVEAELGHVDRDTVAFAVWRGAGRPALLAELRDRGAVMMAMTGVPAAVRRIDAAVLEAVVLQPMLGLFGEQFARTDQVRYVRDLSAATGLVDAGESAAAFVLRAPTVEQVRAVAATGRVMPQKSTYFFPKLYSGFLLNPLENE